MHLIGTRLIRFILFAVLGSGISSCSKATHEEAAAQALLEELQYLDSDHLADNEGWFNWQLATAVRHHGYYNYKDKIRLLKYKLEFDQIRQLYFLTDSIQKSISNRYQEKLKAPLTLEGSELAKLQKMEPVIRQLLHDEDSNEMHLLASYVSPYRDRKKDWINSYLQLKPAYAALLYLEAMKTSLSKVANTIKHEDFFAPPTDGPCSWYDNLYVSYRHYSDSLNSGVNYNIFKYSLNPGETGRAMLFLSSFNNPFFCPPIAYPYPKAFRFNSTNLPVSVDTITRDLVVKIAIPIQAKSMKDSGVKTWSGAWVIALSPEKDTLIHTGGIYKVK